MLTKADIQRLRSLREKKHREELGLFVIEGEKVVTELITTKFPFLELYHLAAWQPPPLPSGCRTVVVDAAAMARISHFPTPSSVLAVGKIVRPELPRAELSRGLTLALDGVQDAGNVGTLLRIADWFGFARVLLSRDCADVFHQKVINASMGSFTHVPAYSVDLAATLASIPAAIVIYGCDLDGTDVHQLNSPANAVVVIGNEGRGLSAEVQRLITQRITIPRFGRAESLNAAVAAGIVCAVLRRTRG